MRLGCVTGSVYTLQEACLVKATSQYSSAFNLLDGMEHLETLYWLAEPLGNFLVVLGKKQHLIEKI